MTRFAATLIDVGWGDSILLEAEEGGATHYALIDCNDSTYQRSALLFVKRHFERRQHDFESAQHNFDFVLLTHGHADHAKGLKRMMNTFGTRFFWYPKSVEEGLVPKLLNFARRSSRVDSHQAINQDNFLGTFGPVTLQALWPPHREPEPHNENLNSIVLAATLGDVCFVFTGDAEASLWDQINSRLPANVRVFQVPHHGARNGLFDGDRTPWLDHLEALNHPVNLCMSSHIRPHRHPDASVIAHLDGHHATYFRTDEHYHVTLVTDGTSPEVEVKYSHV